MNHLPNAVWLWAAVVMCGGLAQASPQATGGTVAAHAQTLEESKRWEEAAAIYLSLQGGDADEQWRFKEAQMWAWTGNHAHAIARLESLIDAHPDHVDARLLLARIHGWAEEWARATAHLDRLDAQEPSDPRVGLVRADLYAYQGEFDRALPHYRQYLESHPNDAAGLKGVARVQLALGDSAGAKKTARRLRDLGQPVEAERILQRSDVVAARFRADVALTYAANTDRANWEIVDAHLSHVLRRDLTVGGGIGVEHRGDRDEVNAMLGADLEARPSDIFSVDVAAAVTPASTFRPRYHARVGSWLTLGAGFDGRLGYRFSDYVRAGADDLFVHGVGPAIRYRQGRVTASAEYRLTLFQPSRDAGHVGDLNVAVSLPAGWSVQAGFAYGVGTEGSAGLEGLLDKALWVTGGVGYAWSWRQGFRMAYALFDTDPLDERPGGLVQHAVVGHYHVRF